MIEAPPDSISFADRAVALPLKFVAGKKRSMSAAFSVIAAASVALARAVQAPEATLYCQAPLVESAVWVVIAIPAKESALEPSVVSEKRAVNRLLTVAPAGSPASSLMAVKVAVPLATGASLSSVTLRVSVAVGWVPEPSVIVYVMTGTEPL